MKKGITVDQTALVAAAFREAGILVHAYLMYGFPSETIQETMDSLERVRQLMEADLIQSAYWHRFTTTAHSPIGLKPAAHGLRILGPEFQGFAENDLLHEDHTGATPTWIGEGLRRSMLNFLEGRGFDLDVRSWFEHPTPKPRVGASWVRRLLKRSPMKDDPKLERRFVWLGKTPVLESVRQRAQLTLPGPDCLYTVTLPHSEAQWIDDLIKRSTPHCGSSHSYPLLRSVSSSFPGGAQQWERLLNRATWNTIRSAGLLLV
jgi:hypothetical protein